MAVFAGTIIGVGIFGLPYIARQSGFLVVVLYFLVIAVMAIMIHFLLGEVARDTHRIARIPGYAEEYLGLRAKKISFVISSLGLIGALLAYLILGGHFLYSLFSSLSAGPMIFYVLIFLFFGAFLIYRGSETIASFQLAIQIVFVGLLVFFFFKGLPYINIENFTVFSRQSIALPYGVVLFSLWGIALVPEVKEMVDRDRQKLLWIISSGIIIAAICYLFFIFTILGVSGAGTTKDAISGFSKSIGNRIIYIGFLFGLITTFTSFITLGLTLKKIFWYDLKLPQRASWAMACFIPLGLYLAGMKNFIDVIGLTGAIFLGLEGVIVILIYRSFIKKRFQRQAGWYIYLLAGLLLVGMTSQIIYFFIR